MGGFRIALQFLTRLPVHAEAPSARDVQTAYYFYPVIGFAIGAAAVVLRHLFAFVFPASFSIVLVLAFLVWVTGGLHEDGLADVADGAGGWTREARLRIMKDSHIGSFGTLALLLAVFAKYAALTSMDTARFDLAMVTAQILGRWAFLPLGYFNPSARDGLGSQFMKTLDRNIVIAVTVVTAALVVLVSRALGAAALGIAAIIIALASAWFRRRLGGVTGDCFGATFQIVEIATYATFLA